MTIPASYQVDFTDEHKDLQERAFQRMLMEFHNSPILLQVLYALVAEIQVLSDAIVAMMEYRTLYQAEGVTLNILSQIVGQNNLGFEMVAQGPILWEDGTTKIVCEDGITTIDAVYKQYKFMNDADHATMILLRIMCNFSKYSSAPEVSNAIYQALGTKIQFQRIGPASLNLIVAPGTLPAIIAMLDQRTNVYQADDVYLFPFPATVAVQVAYSSPIVMEDGVTPIFNEELTEPLYTEQITV